MVKKAVPANPYEIIIHSLKKVQSINNRNKDKLVSSQITYLFFHCYCLLNFFTIDTKLAKTQFEKCRLQYNDDVIFRDNV